MSTKTHKFMLPLEQQLPKNPKRRSKLIPLEEAGKIIAEKSVVSISGTHSLDGAMALIRAALRAGAKNMTLIPPTSTSIAVDLWIAADALKKLYLSYVGFEYLGMAPIAVREVTTFYNMYNQQPVGKYKLNVCTNLPCQLRNGQNALEHLCKALGLEDGGTTADGQIGRAHV